MSSDCLGSSQSLESAYQAALGKDQVTDDAQLELVRRLQRLGDELVRVQTGKSSLRGLLERLQWVRKPSIQGLYIWGGVGRGKTFLMDLFYQWLAIEQKQRLHFHRFMGFVHRRLTAYEGQSEPLRRIAKDYSATTSVLCFDEFFVSDIGDAMILGELLAALFEHGTVLVATSNTKPAGLYENGLQRERFLPAISLLQTKTDVWRLGGDHDYRLDALRKLELFRVCEQASPQQLLDDQNTFATNAPLSQPSLEINDREIKTMFVADGVAGFAFAELCETPRSAADYIEIARFFHTLVLYDIPLLTAAKDNATRRFIALIDEAYDRRVNMAFYAAKDITSLYVGTTLRKEFQRTISRVIEMQSEQYLTQPHRA